MTSPLIRRLALVSCVLSALACTAPSVRESSTGGVGGDAAGGTGGIGGGGVVSKAETAGLWVGESNGIRVCFFVSDDGTFLTSSSECDLGSSASGDASSYGLDVESIGRDENGEPCSLNLRYELDVAIDAATGAFGATFAEPGGDAELAFSGELDGLDASGVATRVEDGSTCTVGWAASRDAPCDEAAINACLDLLDCCRAILVNPVYFQSCDAVVLQCNEQRCRQVLAGYPRCEQLDL